MTLSATFTQTGITLLTCVQSVPASCQQLFCPHLTELNWKIFVVFFFPLCIYRTGKRSTLGLLKDGVNSSIRYYKNNFADGFRQVGHQLHFS